MFTEGTHDSAEQLKDIGTGNSSDTLSGFFSAVHPHKRASSTPTTTVNKYDKIFHIHFISPKKIFFWWE
jgi:hypothetical protein